MNSIETITLENGLTIYLYLDPRRHSTFFQLTTNFGGLNKDFVYNNQEYHMHDGIAHILEHYIVECNDEGNFLQKLGQKQMNTNASTQYQTTNFYFNAVEDIEYGIKTLLNGIYHVHFTKEKLDKLKNPICQEIRGKSNHKFYHSGITTMKNLFSNLNFQSIGGTIEEVEHTTIEEIELCYNAFYHPKNQFIVIGGNFYKESVLRIIYDFYKKHTFPTYHFDLIPTKPDLSVRKKREVIHFPTSLDYVQISFKFDIERFSSKELVDLDFYLNCFYHQFFGIVSPLYQEFIQKKNITSGIHCSHSIIHHNLMISIGAYSYDIKFFQKKILEVIQKQDCFSREQFELEKKSSIVRLILREENIMTMIFPFIQNIVFYHYPFLDQVEDIQKLTYHDYVSTIKSMDFSHYTITIIQNE